MGAAAAEEVERWQRLAAEVVSGDERWRDGLEDAAATPLLDWAIGLTDAAIARLGAAGALDEDAAYDVADGARALLDAAAGALRGDPWEEAEASLLPHLGPPLFESAADGAAAVAALLGRPAAPPAPKSRRDPGAPGERRS